MAEDTKNVSNYLESIIKIKGIKLDNSRLGVTKARINKAFEILPEEVLNLFLGRSRKLSLSITRGSELSPGMRTTTERYSGRPVYSISICDESLGWPEDHFIGALLRELGHVTAELLPENEWPQERGARARYKESIECKADALVWSWGLRHYDMIFLSETYPSHWVDKIVNDISMMLLSMGTAQSDMSLT